jgi:hypothetical protein
MADYGASDTSTTSLGANQFPISEVWTPNAGFSAVEGGTQTTDAGGKKSAPVRVEVKDGSDITQGTSTDANTVNSVMGRLTKIRDLLNATLTVGGTITEANSAASKADLDAINTNIATIVPGVQGWIAATGTGTATTDDSLTFAQAVRKVVLYNASANAVPLEFDQVAAATSFPIQPGQYMVFDDILCTVVHVFPSATLPINTTAGLYVKGWK